MWRLLFRVTVMAIAVLAGHALGGRVGALVGACIGTVMITQIEDIVRIGRLSAELGGSGLRVFWRTLRAFLGHTFVRRLGRAFTIALFAGIATTIGHAVGGVIGAVVASAFTVALCQTVVSGAQSGQQVTQAESEHQLHT
jgi:hypothetical protein